MKSVKKSPNQTSLSSNVSSASLEPTLLYTQQRSSNVYYAKTIWIVKVESRFLYTLRTGDSPTRKINYSIVIIVSKIASEELEIPLASAEIQVLCVNSVTFIMDLGILSNTNVRNAQKSTSRSFL